MQQQTNLLYISFDELDEQRFFDKRFVTDFGEVFTAAEINDIVHHLGRADVFKMYFENQCKVLSVTVQSSLFNYKKEVKYHVRDSALRLNLDVCRPLRLPVLQSFQPMPQQWLMTN